MSGASVRCFDNTPVAKVEVDGIDGTEKVVKDEEEAQSHTVSFKLILSPACSCKD
jgi:hypothetical protein